MKKMIKLIFALGVLSIIYQFFVLLFLNNHEASYSIKTSNNSYMIEEKYEKNGDFNIYSMLIEDKNKTKFVVSYNKDINKQSQIIKDIKEYKDNDIYCIAPVLKGKQIENISCIYKKQQVSISYLHQIGNDEINSFIKKLKKEKYKINDKIDKSGSIIKKENNISIYDNIDEKIYITMWGYKSLHILNNKTITTKNLLSNDSYFNDYGILCGKYYVLMNTDDDSFVSFYVINIKDGGKAKVEFNYEISKNSYFNGIYEDKVYLTDIRNDKQYVINPAKEKIEEIDNEKEAKYYDGKTLDNVDIDTLTENKKYFIYSSYDSKIAKVYKEYNLIESYGNYYYQDNDNGVYQVVGNFPEYKILLFKFDDFKELKVVDNNVFGVSNDTIYMYNNAFGLKKVASNRELSYNYKNIYDVYYS